MVKLNKKGNKMFTEMPRYIGTPAQIWVETEFAFKRFEKMFSGRVPFMVSINPYTNKTTPIISTLFFDLDSYYGLRTPYRSTKRLKDWCLKHDIQPIINFSGAKGFHLFINFKYVIPKSEEEKQKIKTLMYSIQKCLLQELEIYDYDDPTLGRIRFLCRYPSSLYLRKDEETNKLESSGFYCRNLTMDEFDGGLKHISKLVKEPGIVPNGEKPTKTLSDIARLIPNFKIKERQNGMSEQLLLARCGMEVPSIAALGIPCLQDMVKHLHPGHFERIELVSWLKHLGYSDLAITAFIKDRNWTRYKANITAYQVSTVKPRIVKCSYLKESYGHLCDKCTYRRS